MQHLKSECSQASTSTNCYYVQRKAEIQLLMTVCKPFAATLLWLILHVPARCKPAFWTLACYIFLGNVHFENQLCGCCEGEGFGALLAGYRRCTVSCIVHRCRNSCKKIRKDTVPGAQVHLVNAVGKVKFGKAKFGSALLRFSLSIVE